MTTIHDICIVCEEGADGIEHMLTYSTVAFNTNLTYMEVITDRTHLQKHGTAFNGNRPVKRVIKGAWLDVVSVSGI